MIPQILEPARATPVVYDCDFCVVGGSCTGVFAAVRAARRGLRVAIVELNTIFGGTATAAQVNEWHSLYDVAFEQEIIGGLTRELMSRLQQRGVVQELPRGQRGQFKFNSAEMAAELDALVTQHQIRPFLGAVAVAAQREGNRINALVIEDKSGRRAIRARVFLDASGDGDLLRRAGFAATRADELQPVNLQATVHGWDAFYEKHPDSWPWGELRHRAEEYGYPTANSSPWLFPCPGAPELRNVFGPRMNGIDASDADQRTEAMMTARRYHRALNDMAQAELGIKLTVVGWAHALGIRQTWQAQCLYQLTGADLLHGTAFPDAIANGTYPVDIHHPGGTMLRYLDGREERIVTGAQVTWSRWKPEGAPNPRCYHVPYRSLVPREAENLLVAGRLLDADREAFGGVRVMVNCDQMGEAAGEAAALACEGNLAVPEVPAAELRARLAEGGSIIL